MSPSVRVGVQSPAAPACVLLQEPQPGASGRFIAEWDREGLTLATLESSGWVLGLLWVHTSHLEGSPGHLAHPKAVSTDLLPDPGGLGSPRGGTFGK